MIDPTVATFAILALAVVGFMTNRLPLVVVALFVPVALWATGVLPLGDALAGFSDPIVLFIASLFVLSDALDSTGITAWIGQWLERRASWGRTGLLLVMIGVAAALAAGIVPSRMLIPLAFAAGAGSLLTLTGTPVNIIVSEAAAEAGGREFGYFEFALVGVPLVLATAVLVVTLGGRLLPERVPEHLGDTTTDPRERVRSWQESYAAELDTGRLFTGGSGVAEVLIA